MKFSELLFYLFVSSLIVFFCKEARSYDIICHVPFKDDSIVISTPNRSVYLVSTTDSGETRTLKVSDVLVPSNTSDYVKYTDGKHTMTYSVECESL